MISNFLSLVIFFSCTSTCYGISLGSNHLPRHSSKDTIPVADTTFRKYSNMNPSMIRLEFRQNCSIYDSIRASFGTEFLEPKGLCRLRSSTKVLAKYYGRVIGRTLQQQRRIRRSVYTVLEYLSPDAHGDYNPYIVYLLLFDKLASESNPNADDIEAIVRSYVKDLYNVPEQYREYLVYSFIGVMPQLIYFKFRSFPCSSYLNVMDLFVNVLIDRDGILPNNESLDSDF